MASTHNEVVSLPQDQNVSQTDSPSRRVSQQSMNSDFLQSSLDEQSNMTGESLHLSSLRSLNYEGDDEHVGSQPYEDDKARMMTQLMQNHAHAVTASLVERTLLIQSVIWLSHHVPRCVLDLLFENILRDRNALEDRHDRTDLEHSMNDLCIEDKSPGDLKDEKEITGCSSYNDASLHSLNSSNENESHPNPSCHEERLPISKNHNSALLFVDMSGFTKISTVLDVESLSNAINSYFTLIVDEVITYGGDILKFAGDAIFAEWKVSTQKPDRTIEYCVMQAAECAASIVANCSDYPVHSKPIGKSRASFRVENARHSFRGPRSSFRASLKSSTQSQSSDRNLRGSVQSADECLRRRSGSMESIEDHELNRRRSTDAGRPFRKSSAGLGSRPVKLATLNVKCSIGVGHVVGIHVGDDVYRREYLILGDPIEQIAAAEVVASKGEVVASPQALKILSNFVTWKKQSFDESLTHDKPKCIAERQDRFYDINDKFLPLKDRMSDEPDSILCRCEELHTSELRSLKRVISLYVHEVVVNDENESQTQVSIRGRGSDVDRHLSQAELRNVFVAFISPMIDYNLTGDAKKDRKLYNLLNDIMKLTTRTLHKIGGHLRQFIVDDKGICLICTFGLRNSTFPNMISQRALPLTRSIHDAMQEGLGIRSKIGATFGRAYCGVVGGMSRHEFAVMGPSVNLAARLTGNSNPGIILVDKSIRLLTSHSQIFFKPHPAVNAKGYDEPVAIFEPIKSNDNTQLRKLEPNFVGRITEIKHVMQIAKEIALVSNEDSKWVFIEAASGMGKSSMIAQTSARIQAMMERMNKSVIVTRHTSNEGDTRLPFSLFRSIFKSLLNEMKHAGWESRSHQSLHQDEASHDVSVEEVWDDLSLRSQSTKDSILSTDGNRFLQICEELDAPKYFVDVVGRRMLGIRDKNIVATKDTPDLDSIVYFLADAFIRCTKHADLTVLVLDDVHDMDEMSWKVVREVFVKSENLLIVCGSRPTSINPLVVQSEFWDELYDCITNKERFVKMDLCPLTEGEVCDFIAISLGVDPSHINDVFSRGISKATGGLPHFLCYTMEAIKRQELFTKLENGLIGLKDVNEDKLGFGSVSELLLYRLDGLDSSVRNGLHIASILGTEFELLDACLVFDEMYSIADGERSKSTLMLREAFHAAVEEGILEEFLASAGDGEDEEVEEPLEVQTSLCASLGNIILSLSYRKSHPAYSDNRRYRFVHDSWKTSITNIMLDERVQEIHEHVAIVLEREIDTEDQEGDDFESQIRVFRHWAASGHFINASEYALDIGSHLMSLGLNSQSILLFDDVLDTLRDSSADPNEEIMFGGISVSVLDAIEASELETLIKIFVAKGKACSTIGKGRQAAESLQNALDVLKNAPAANNEHFDRSISFPIFSGLFVVLKMGAITDDGACTYEKSLVKEFVEQARLNKDPVHYGRALAMEGETLGRLGLFEQAIETLERIQAIYDIETQHSAICKAYASDRVAQAYSHAVNWLTMLGRDDEVVKRCKYIVEELAPKSDPKNVHNSFCLLFSTITAMKEDGRALEASGIFNSFVVEPFNKHFGPGGSTYSKPLFDPILMLLDLQGHQDEPIERIKDYLKWAMSDDIFSVSTSTYDRAWSAFSASPKTLLGEICYFLAKRPECSKERNKLIETGLKLVEASIKDTDNFLFANTYAKKRLDMLRGLNNITG